MYEIKEAPKVGIKIFDTVYELDRPSVGQAEDLQDLIEDKEKKKKLISIMVGYFHGLGLPKEVARKMKVDQMTELAEFMAKPKKK